MARLLRTYGRLIGTFVMLRSLIVAHGEGSARAHIPKTELCEEKLRLLSEFLATVHELTAILKAQAQAALDGDPDFERFDLLLHVAREKKDWVKYKLIAHVDEHGCHEEDKPMALTRVEKERISDSPCKFNWPQIL